MQEREKSVSDVAVPAAAAVASNIPRVTAHVTDTVTGRPAAGVALKLFTENQSGTWSHVADRYVTVLVGKHTPTNVKSGLFRVTTLPGKSCNLVRLFSRPGKSWKTGKVMKSHGQSWKMMMMSWNFFVKMH